MFKKVNTDSISKAMQNSGLKKALSELKELDTSFCTYYDVSGILKTIRNILYCYNCISANCLQKRIKHILKTNSVNELGYNIKSLIAELETFLNSDISESTIIEL